MTKKTATNKADKKKAAQPEPNTLPGPQVQSVPLEEKAPVVSVSDLKGAIRVIDLASTRGAFKAGELELVGSLYNRIKRFVDWYDQIQAAKQDQENKKDV